MISYSREETRTATQRRGEAREMHAGEDEREEEEETTGRSCFQYGAQINGGF